MRNLKRSVLTILTCWVITGIFSCKKQEATSAPINQENKVFLKTYLDYNLYESSFARIDIDEDSVTDFTFKTTTENHNGYQVIWYTLECAPDTQIETIDKHWGSSSSQIRMIGATNPNKSILWKNELIYLLQKTVYDNGTIYRQGQLNLSANKYIGVRIFRKGGHYYGWLQLSHKGISSGSDAIFLTRSAVSKTSDNPIQTHLR